MHEAPNKNLKNLKSIYLKLNAQSFITMDFFSSLPASIYNATYNWVVFILCLFVVFRHISSEGNRLIYSPVSLPIPAIILTILIIIPIGFRNPVGYFGDTYFYTHTFLRVLKDYSPIDWSREWIFDNWMFFFKDHGLPIQYFYLSVSIVYFGTMFVSCYKLSKNNTWIALLFCLVSYSCYSYSTNGVRNGVACNMVMLGIVYLTETDWRKFLSLAFFIIAYGIHHSSALPALAAITATFVIKEPKYALRFWVASIFISLIAGNYIGDIFGALGFDDRMSDYFQGQENEEMMEQFSQTGFRFDFLLYSAMPVLMIWYITVKRNFLDRTYNIIANTYIMTNAFWIMVIRAAFSNRFAYLSWFIYPLVICYPLLRMNIWEDQDKKTAQILLAYAGFTFFMFLIGK